MICRYSCCCRRCHRRHHRRRRHRFSLLPPPPPTHIHTHTVVNVVVIVCVVTVYHRKTYVQNSISHSEHSAIQYNTMRSDTYLSSSTTRMRILVPLKRERLCAWFVSHLFLVSFTHTFFHTHLLSLSLSLCARYIELNKLSARGSFNATGSFAQLAYWLVLMDGWMVRIRSRHCTHNMLDGSHFSIFIYTRVLTKCTLPYYTKSFAYRLAYSRYVLYFCFYHYYSLLRFVCSNCCNIRYDLHLF